ncbi:DUF4369 domain-containing protein [Capnocytophaga canimorsus]|uniref:DUF4369 domain-containing protein n=1 Tax=Capnocytophaga canimorsus TaxID=28188 RepID=UPI001BB30D9C|nr:DUF4369 domain-containing protein [Capnocytophaga canimorsus]
MKKIILTFLLPFAFFACADDSQQMIVEGNIEGLKKGTVFLQRYDEGKLVNLDSMVAKGEGKFRFVTPLESPEIFYIYLDLNKQEGTDFGDRLLFFGEPTKITIESTHKMFDINAKVSGSESQKILEQYNKMMRKFGTRNMELLEQQINAVKEGQSQKVDSLKELSEKNTLRKYLFSVNYAINHSDSYVAPYIALTDIFDANVKYLDSVYNKLSPEVAKSKYGKELQTHIEEVKKNQSQSENP